MPTNDTNSTKLSKQCGTFLVIQCSTAWFYTASGPYKYGTLNNLREDFPNATVV
jgi:hypothetical protein